MCRVPGGNNRGVQGCQNFWRDEDQSQGDPDCDLARRPRWGGGSLRAFRRAVLFGLVAWWLVGLLSLRLSVCSFDHGGFLRTFWELAWGLLGSFWELGGSLGHHFGVSGLLVGSILGVWGPLGLHFWRSGASLAPLAPPGWPHWPPKAPKVKFSHFFPLHFRVIFGTFWS